MHAIGLMVGLLLAGLLGWYFINRRTGGNILAPSNPPIITNDGRPNPATAPPGSVINGISYGGDGKPLTTDGTAVTFGGTDFVTNQSSAGKLAAMTGATAYDPNNPAVALRTVDAINVATTANAYLQANTDAYNAANGTNWTTDQFAAFQASTKLQQSQASSFAASNEIVSHNGTSDPPTPSPGPGYYWNYIFKGWTPLPTGTVTAPTTETRTGKSHF